MWDIVCYELHNYSSSPQILPAYLETVERRLLDLAAHLLESRSLQALSALVVEAWHLKDLDSPVQTKQVLCLIHPLRTAMVTCEIFRILPFRCLHPGLGTCTGIVSEQ